MALPDGPTVHFFRTGGLTQADLLQALQKAIAENPTLFLKTMESLDDIPDPLVEMQVAFIDSLNNPDTNGVYGYYPDRDWKRLRKTL